MTITIVHVEDGIKEIIGNKVNIMIGMVGSTEIQHHHINIGVGKTLNHNNP